MKVPIQLSDLKNSACAHLNQHLFVEVEKKVKKRSKYNNVKVEFGGYVFDSQKECNVYIALRMRLVAGEITDLKLQVPYELNEGGTHSYKYFADFEYIENGKLITADAKGFKTAVYNKKKKLMQKVYGIEIIEM